MEWPIVYGHWGNSERGGDAFADKRYIFRDGGVKAQVDYGSSFI